MAWEGFGMVGASAATPGGVGWVFIATPYKLDVAVQKLAVMTCTGAALPQLLETAPATSQKMP